MAGRQGNVITPGWLRPATLCAVAALHAAVIFGVPWPSEHEAAVTAPIAVIVVPQGMPAPSMAMPDPAEAVEIRPTSTAAVDNVQVEAETVQKAEPTEETRERSVEVAKEAKPPETAAARAPDRLARAVTPPTSAERIDRTEQPEQRPDRPIESATPPSREAVEVTATVTNETAAVQPNPQQAPAVERIGPVQQAMRSEPNEAVMRDRPAPGDPKISNEKKPEKEKQDQKKKPRSRSTASTSSSANSPSQQSPVASVSGSAASANYRSLVMAELNRRKFMPSGARDARGVVYVTFSVGSSGAVTSFNISRSSGNSTLDGAVLQMMRSVSLPPPPGGSFRATAPVHFNIQR